MSVIVNPFIIGATVTGVEIDRLLGSVITNFDTRTGEAADGITSQAAAAATRQGSNASNRYWGKDYGVSSEKLISKATAHGSNDLAYHDSGSGTSTTIDLRADSSAPNADGSSGTLLGTITFTQSSSEATGRDINSGNYGPWRYVWLRISNTAAANNMSLAEGRFFA